MKYIINNSNIPPYNIALEAYAFKELLDIDEIFILWVNKPAIIIGKHQNALEEINKKYVDENGIHVVRRISGGGAVYHDLQNLNYTIISSKTNEPFDFKTFSLPVIETLAQLGVKAECTGRNDIVIDGKKICGNAQAYYKGRMMHHGCLLLDVDLSVLTNALTVSKDKIQSKGIKSVRSRVTNINDELPEKISMDKFKSLLMEYMKSHYPDMSEYVLNENDLKRIQEIHDTQFASWDWVYGKAPEYTIRREQRYTNGKISVFVDVKKSIINNIKIYGDFFGMKDVSDIEEKLKGVKYDKQSVLDALSHFDIQEYFAKISIDEVANAIVE